MYYFIDIIQLWRAKTPMRYPWRMNSPWRILVRPKKSLISQRWLTISCFPLGYREISVKIFFGLKLISPVKIPIFMFLLPRLIADVSQPDGNMT